MIVAIKKEKLGRVAKEKKKKRKRKIKKKERRKIERRRHGGRNCVEI